MDGCYRSVCHSRGRLPYLFDTDVPSRIDACKIRLLLFICDNISVFRLKFRVVFCIRSGSGIDKNGASWCLNRFQRPCMLISYHNLIRFLFSIDFDKAAVKAYFYIPCLPYFLCKFRNRPQAVLQLNASNFF